MSPGKEQIRPDQYITQMSQEPCLVKPGPKVETVTLALIRTTLTETPTLVTMSQRSTSNGTAEPLQIAQMHKTFETKDLPPEEKVVGETVTVVGQRATLLRGVEGQHGHGNTRSPMVLQTTKDGFPQTSATKRHPEPGALFLSKRHRRTKREWKPVWIKFNRSRGGDLETAFS